ncbi:hypothetical protein DEF53_01345 [Neisseria meningitidis]|nr:hypothetical protein [Neisseria meningitidis]MBG8753318.1 hypothetical protein [Neisseria meningitidis]MBG8769606.1 hypothetical protein [Neisseria meningitidis]MBG8989700.1 hypothetical protein [Neisseria meningitidis]MBG8993955.1 hypothetical protein [Neisseria meningitidis]
MQNHRKLSKKQKPSAVVPAKAGIRNRKPQKFIGKTETQKQRKPNGQDSRLRGNDGSYITQKIETKQMGFPLA